MEQDLVATLLLNMPSFAGLLFLAFSLQRQIDRMWEALEDCYGEDADDLMERLP